MVENALNSTFDARQRQKDSEECGELQKDNGTCFEIREFFLTLNKPSVLVLFALRVLASILVPVSDCDEVFNYWEPLHFLIYGSGLQTWEYSPEFALRSYGFLQVAMLPSIIPVLLGFDKYIVFVCIKVSMAFFAAYAEHFFVESVRKKYGANVGRNLYYALISSWGMSAATASIILPNSAAMSLGMIILGLWMRKHYIAALYSSAFLVIVVSPFVAVVFVPMVIDIILSQGFITVFSTGLRAVMYILIPAIIIDYFYYGFFVVSAWNIIEYNAIASEERGAELYGVESWTYYAINLALNFNVVVFIGIPLFIVISPFKLKIRDLFVLFSGLIWLLLMGTRPHKEERFLFPIYPFFALYFAFVVDWVMDTAKRCSFRSQHGQVVKQSQAIDLLSRGAFCILFTGIALISLSRGIGQILYFSGASRAYTHLYKVEIPMMASRAKVSM